MAWAKKYKGRSVALLIAGSAILLIACSKKRAVDEAPPENLITQQSDTLTRYLSENGIKSYRFHTPLLEEYAHAPEPYIEFRRGIEIITYDSLGAVRSTLVADYAINFTRQKLWEAKGNVRVTNNAGDRLETQQLFWNQATGRIYSNIDTKLTQGEDVLYGEGFESDEEFKVWEFRNPRGRLRVDLEPNRDTTVNVPATPSINVPETPAANGPTTPPAPATLTTNISATSSTPHDGNSNQNRP